MNNKLIIIYSILIFLKLLKNKTTFFKNHFYDKMIINLK